MVGIGYAISLNLCLALILAGIQVLVSTAAEFTSLGQSSDSLPGSYAAISIWIWINFKEIIEGTGPKGYVGL